MPLRFVKGVRDRGLSTFRLPLLRTGRALRQLPLVFEKILKKQVAPFRWRLCPGDFGTAGDGIGSYSCAVSALPAKALVLDGAAFRLRTDERGITRAVGLAKTVAAGDQRDGLFIVHGHAEEGLADVFGRSDRVRIAVRAFRIDVD